LRRAKSRNRAEKPPNGLKAAYAASNVSSLASFVRLIYILPPPSSEEHILHQGYDSEHEDEDDE
jgi:hypothetical protein